MYGSPRRKDLSEYISSRIVRHGAQSSSTRIDCQVAPTLWTRCRDWVDWCDESHALRGGRNPAIDCPQPSFELGVQHLGPGSLYDDHWGNRTHHCCATRGKTLVPTRFGTRKPGRHMYVSDNAFLHYHDTRLGTKPRRISCSVRWRRRVFDQRFCFAWCLDLDLS
jgi:hypothetical protein